MTDYRVGIDIGGTFTDATVIDETTGALEITKVLSTPADPSVGFVESLDRLLRNEDIDPASVRLLVHATTVATNSIIEGKTARAGLITTQGFRDILEIGRQLRPSLYDIHFEKPPPIVPRHLAIEVPERLDAEGNVLLALDEEAVRAAAEVFRREGVESIAISFLHGYLNPVHEERAAEIVQRAYPDAHLSLSSEVAPEFREYVRTSTTVINAAIRPIVGEYLEQIEHRAAEVGTTCDLLVMQSSGGVYSSGAARRTPVFMVESGPAAGVIAATHLGGVIGVKDMLSFDMGGTTAKAGLIANGRPHVTKEYEVGATAQAGVGGKSRGSGYPVLTPVIDLVEIGAGGGSTAWVDPGGALRVGPGSAGAAPGPACYGRGGREPTVTDANLVLGRLNPGYFLGGEMTLDVDAAMEAIDTRCAQQLGMSTVETALGIVEIANAAMVNALRLVSIQRGYDARDFVLVGFGGAGPMHANRLAEEMGMSVVVIPVRPGIFSSLGLLVTDIKRDYSATYLAIPTDAALAEIQHLFTGLEGRARSDLGAEGIAETDMAFHRFLDMRYVGQSYELTIPISADELDAAALGPIVAEFNKEHDRAYGFNAPEEQVEIVTARLTAYGLVPKPVTQELSHTNGAGATALKGSRPVAFAEGEGHIDVEVYDRYALARDQEIEGPAIVEEVESSTVIHPGYRAKVDRFGNLWIRKEGASKG